MRKDNPWKLSKQEEDILTRLMEGTEDRFLQGWASKDIRQVYRDKIEGLGYVIEHSWPVGPIWFSYHSVEHPEVHRMMCEVLDVENMRTMGDLMENAGLASIYYTQDCITELWNEDYEDAVTWFVYDLVYCDWHDDHLNIYWQPGFVGTKEALDLIDDEIESLKNVFEGVDDICSN